MKQPKITIITPTWNRPLDVIERCIKCVEYQTFQDYEHIICSDGYEEKVKEFVESQKNPKLTYHSLDKHYGDYANTIRQTCLEKARGEYILFLDDDNVIFPHYLEKMYFPLKESEENVAFTICQIMHLGPLPSHLGPAPQILDGIPVKVQNVDTLNLLIKKKHLLSIGGWNLEKGYLADGYTYEKLADTYEYIQIKELLGVHI